MAVSCSGRANQARPGAAINASLMAVFPTETDWQTENAMGFGVKATNTAPAVVGDFAATIDDTGRAIDRWAMVNEDVEVPQGTIQTHRLRFNLQKRIPYGGSYVAGHYLFAYVSDLSNNVIAHGAPYLIR